MIEDVRITLGRTGMVMVLGRRNRRDFRDRVARELGARWVRNGSSTADQMNNDDLPKLQAILAEEYGTWRVEVNDERPKQLQPEDRVWWALERDSYGARWNGYVGDVKLFSTASYYRREKGNQYVLRTTLPGYFDDRSLGCTKTPFATQGEAQAYAEGMVERFLSRLGATFKD